MGVDLGQSRQLGRAGVRGFVSLGAGSSACAPGSLCVLDGLFPFVSDVEVVRLGYALHRGGSV